MSEADERDEVTGRTVAEMEALANDLYAHRDEVEGEEVAAEPVTDIRSVVSVRFARSELDSVAAAAAAAGLPLSTYIRNAALATAVAIDIEAARRELRAATKALDELGRKLGPAA